MKKEQKLTFALLIIYLLAITWIILFKMQISLSALPHIRSINLIPFSESAITNGKTNLGEIINNLIVFIPVGLYVGMLWHGQPFYKKVMFPFCLSFTYELLQFILSAGATDITDIIMNTLGGITGLLLLIPLTKLLGEKAHQRLNILALISTFLVIGLILLLIIYNK